MRCPKCGTDCPEDYNFCELDGTPLKGQPAPQTQTRLGPCCRCGAPIKAAEQDGFCSSCGELWEARNHKEYDMGTEFGAITDRGSHHPRNEDCLCLAVEQTNGRDYRVLVVCDGLSSAQRSSEASDCAANAAQSFLSHCVQSGAVDKESSIRSAILEAHAAVCALEFDKQGQKEPPGTTIVAALVDGKNATIGWVGDSRAYLLSSDTTTLLTHDHSWVNEAVASGITESEAISSDKAHMITHCIGPVEMATAGVVPEPSVVSVELPSHSWLLLCSDGLWNYAQSEAEFDALMQSAPTSTNAMTLASHLVAFAISQGGRDNISVALSRTTTGLLDGIQN